MNVILLTNPLPISSSSVFPLPPLTFGGRRRITLSPFTHIAPNQTILTKRVERSVKPFTACSLPRNELEMLFYDAHTRTCRYISAVFAKQLVDVSLLKLGIEMVKYDIRWTALVEESNLVEEFDWERKDSAINFLLRREPLQTSPEYLANELSKILKRLEDGFNLRYSRLVERWVEFYGLQLFENPLAVDLILEKRKYRSAFIALVLSGNDDIKKLKATIFEELIWEELVAESELAVKYKSDLYEAELRYFRYKAQQPTSENDFEEKLYKLVMKLEDRVPRFSALVARWLRNYVTPESNKTYVTFAIIASNGITELAAKAAADEDPTQTDADADADAEAEADAEVPTQIDAAADDDADAEADVA